MNSIEILATIIIALAIIKMLVILISAKSWVKFAKAIYKNTTLVQVAGIILAAIVLYYLTAAGITIIQIMAVAVFMSLLIMVGIAPYAKDMFKFIKLKDVWKNQWPYVIIWLILIIWAIIELI